MARSVGLDFEQDVRAFRKIFIGDVLGGAIAIADELGMLEKRPFFQATVEFLAADEEIVFTIDFARSWRAGGHGDGEVKGKLRHRLQNLAHGAFAYPRRARQDDEQTFLHGRMIKNEHVNFNAHLREMGVLGMPLRFGAGIMTSCR